MGGYAVLPKPSKDLVCSVVVSLKFSDRYLRIGQLHAVVVEQRAGILPDVLNFE